MALDVSRVTADPSHLKLPGATTLEFTAATVAARGQVDVCYFIEENVPIVFFETSRGISKEVWKKSVQLTSVHRPITQKLNLSKEPEDAPAMSMVQIQIKIQEIDDTGQPQGSVVRRSCMISLEE